MRNEFTNGDAVGLLRGQSGRTGDPGTPADPPRRIGDVWLIGREIGKRPSDPLASANAAVTAKAFWSAAGDGSKRVTPTSSASACPASQVLSTSPLATATASGPFSARFKNSVYVPRYSGMTWTSPAWRAGARTSRLVDCLMDVESRGAEHARIQLSEDLTLGEVEGANRDRIGGTRGASGGDECRTDQGSCKTFEFASRDHSPPTFASCSQAPQITSRHEMRSPAGCASRCTQCHTPPPSCQ
jgi:hypothetical protein